MVSQPLLGHRVTIVRSTVHQRDHVTNNSDRGEEDAAAEREEAPPGHHRDQSAARQQGFKPY